MNAAVYARKSTDQDDVAEDSRSVPRQIEGGRAFITSKGWTLTDSHVYADDGVSGALFADRPDFQRMMSDAKAGQFDAVVFYDLDRFGRHAHHTMVSLNALADLGVSVWDFSTGIRVDLDSFEGRISTSLKAEFAQQFRDQARKHTRTAMLKKAQAGFVCGGKTFGYDNKRVSKGQVKHVINDAEAAIVVEIHTRYADGAGVRSIADILNRKHALSPRAEQGRPCGWSSSTIRAVLDRPLYRGEVIYGRTKKAYGREIGRGTTREKAQIDNPEWAWIRHDVPALRIISPDLAARVDARRKAMGESYKQSVSAKAERVRAPEKSWGKYLLSGGMLICPTCGGHFEALQSGGSGGVYLCATRRRKPGVCSNTLTLPMLKTDATVLEMIESEILTAEFVEELLLSVDRGESDESAQWTADRDRLRAEVDRLVGSIAAGVPADTVAKPIRERQTAISGLDARLAAPRPDRPDIEALRLALTRRTTEWKLKLQKEVSVARQIVRKIVGPLELWDATDPGSAWSEWSASVTDGLTAGLVHLVASPAARAQGCSLKPITILSAVAA